LGHSRSEENAHNLLALLQGMHEHSREQPPAIARTGPDKSQSTLRRQQHIEDDDNLRRVMDGLQWQTEERMLKKEANGEWRRCQF